MEGLSAASGLKESCRKGIRPRSVWLFGCGARRHTKEVQTRSLLVLCVNPSLLGRNNGMTAKKHSFHILVVKGTPIDWWSGCQTASLETAVECAASTCELVPFSANLTLEPVPLGATSTREPTEHPPIPRCPERA